MNAIAIIVLIALVGDSILNFIGDYLNLRHLRDEVPAEFEDVFEADQYRLSQTYLMTRTRFGWLTAAFNLALVLIFWFSHGFDSADQWVRSFGFGPVLTGVIFTGILLLARAVLSLPFSCYSTFVIESKFGFNRTTIKTFVFDLIKGLGLAIILGAPLLALVFAFFEYAGPHAWLYCWMAVTAFTLVVQFVAPTLIMPLFNKYTPLRESDLREAIMSYARSIDFPLRNIFVMDGSKRSSKSNAFFTGFGRNKRIVLFDTLVDQHTVAELVAVLAHEMGHYKKKHIIKSILMGIIQTGLLFFWSHSSFQTKNFLTPFSCSRHRFTRGCCFSACCTHRSIFSSGSGCKRFRVVMRMKRTGLQRATTGAPEALVDALKKLSVNNLSNLCPHPLYVFLNYSHPPVLERIRAIRLFQSPETEFAHVS